MLYDPKWEEAVAPELEDWRRVLLTAADLVRKRGLAKYTQQAPDGSVCVQGAISIAAVGYPYGGRDAPEYCEATYRLAGYLRAKGIKTADGFGNADWNNAHERTPDEVIAALEGAAKHS